MSVIISALWREHTGAFLLIQLNPSLPDPCQVAWDQLEANPQPLLAKKSLIPWMEYLIYTRVATLRPGHSHSANQTLSLARPYTSLGFQTSQTVTYYKMS